MNPILISDIVQLQPFRTDEFGQAFRTPARVWKKSASGTIALLIILTFLFPRPPHAWAAPPAGYSMVFSEEFDGPLNVSATGPIPPAKWIATTPYNTAGFGKAWFGTGKQLSIDSNGHLVITAWNDTTNPNPAKRHWRSGCLASVDTKGNGFSQALGYWEWSLHWPGWGPGTWPALWLAGVSGVTHTGNTAEIDVLEAYASNPSETHQTVHLWDSQGHQIFGLGHKKVWNITDGFHTFGCLIQSDLIHFYIDDAEVWSTPSFPEALQPLYCMVDLALTTTKGAVDPSYLYVDYVRCYAPPK